MPLNSSSHTSWYSPWYEPPCCITITVLCALFPLASVAIIDVLPSLTPVTRPVWSTAAILSFADDHVTFVSGTTLSCCVFFTSRVKDDLLITKFPVLPPSTTNTIQVAEALPILAVMVTSPSALAVTTPLITVATATLDDSHVIVPLPPLTSASIISTSPTDSCINVGERLIVTLFVFCFWHAAQLAASTRSRKNCLIFISLLVKLEP